VAVMPNPPRHPCCSAKRRLDYRFRESRPPDMIQISKSLT
jgi:hypothetical protein